MTIKSSIDGGVVAVIVLLGANDKKNPDESIPSVAVIVHESFSLDPVMNDVGLVKLAKAVQPSSIFENEH